MTSSFNSERWTAVLDRPAEISQNEIYDYTRAQSTESIIPISQAIWKATI